MKSGVKKNIENISPDADDDFAYIHVFVLIVIYLIWA